MVNSPIIFNSSNDNTTICSVFRVLDDQNIENNETFYFQATPQNSRDTFVGDSFFRLTVYDNDGMFVCS